MKYINWNTEKSLKLKESRGICFEDAVVEGLPYQTYVSSIIHKFLNGKLIEAKNANKTFQQARD